MKLQTKDFLVALLRNDARNLLDWHRFHSNEDTLLRIIADAAEHWNRAKQLGNVALLEHAEAQLMATTMSRRRGHAL